MTEDQIKALKSRAKKYGDDMFKSLLREYDKEWNQNLNIPDEALFIEAKLPSLIEYIDTVKQAQANKVVNGFVQQNFKAPADWKYLPGYIDFLQWLNNRHIEVKQTVTTDSVRQSVKGYNEHSSSNAPITGFEVYLIDANIISKLIGDFSRVSPKEISLMIFALYELNQLNTAPGAIGATKLHKSLLQSFGDVGTRQALNGNLNIYSSKPLRRDRIVEIDAVKLKLSNLLA